MTTGTSNAEVYYRDYPGHFAMLWHDVKRDLERWIDNWALDKYAGLSEQEWITIEEKTWSVRGKQVSQYLGTIGADHHTNKRVVKFEPGAPPPPIFFRPVVQKYEPPPPEPRWMEERRHREYEMLRRFYSFTPQQRFVANVLPPIDPPPPRYRRNI